MTPTIDVVDMMDTPGGRDEVGVQEDQMSQCPGCEVALPLEHGYWHRCEDGSIVYYDAHDEEWVGGPPADIQEVPTDA